MPANPAFRGAYRSRTGVSVVTKDSAQSACVELDFVQNREPVVTEGQFARGPEVLTATDTGNPEAVRHLVRGASALRLAARKPPQAEDPLPDRVLTEHLADRLGERLDQAESPA